MCNQLHNACTIDVSHVIFDALSRSSSVYIELQMLGTLKISSNADVGNFKNMFDIWHRWCGKQNTMTHYEDGRLV